MIHPLSNVQSQNIGKNTNIWQFVVVLPGAKIGSNCNICSHCFIENDVVIGNNVTLKFYIELCDGVTLEDDVFIAPNVSFTNDTNPRSKKHLAGPYKTLIKRGVSIAAGSTILPEITIGEYAFIGAGSVITKDIPPYQLWYGNPAKHKGYVTKEGEVVGLDLISKTTGNRFQYINNKLILL